MSVVPNLSKIAEEAIYAGSAEIKVVGRGKVFELQVRHSYVEVEGKYNTYTDALERAVFIVNEVG